MAASVAPKIVTKAAATEAAAVFGVGSTIATIGNSVVQKASRIRNIYKVRERIRRDVKKQTYENEVEAMFYNII